MIESLVKIGFKPFKPFKPYKPLAERSRDRLFDQFTEPPTRELRSFYAACNGGRISKLGLRFFRLAEAVDAALSYADIFRGFSVFPLLANEDAGSDPFALALSGPLKGSVYWHPHDASPKLLAPTLSSFARALVKAANDGRLFGDAQLVYPKALSKKEQAVHSRLLAFADTLDKQGESAAGFVRDIANSMPLADRGEAFVDRCIKCLRCDGIQVKREGYFLFLGERRRKFHVKYYEKDSARPDFDAYFLQVVRRILGISRDI